MSKLYYITNKMLAVLLLSAFIPVAHAEIAVITNPNVKEIGLSQDDVANIYLDKKKTFADGTLAKPVDQGSDTEIRKKFYKLVVKMTASEANRYWAKLEFTGRGTPPRVISGDQAVKSWVASHPGAIGYIDGKYLDSSVKVVLILP